jgi:hypothetical protein
MNRMLEQEADVANALAGASFVFGIVVVAKLDWNKTFECLTSGNALITETE